MEDGLEDGGLEVGLVAAGQGEGTAPMEARSKPRRSAMVVIGHKLAINWPCGSLRLLGDVEADEGLGGSSGHGVDVVAAGDGGVDVGGGVGPGDEVGGGLDLEDGAEAAGVGGGLGPGDGSGDHGWHGRESGGDGIAAEEVFDAIFHAVTVVVLIDGLAGGAGGGLPGGVAAGGDGKRAVGFVEAPGVGTAYQFPDIVEVGISEGSERAVHGERPSKGFGECGGVQQVPAIAVGNGGPGEIDEELAIDEGGAGAADGVGGAVGGGVELELAGGGGEGERAAGDGGVSGVGVRAGEDHGFSAGDVIPIR